MKAKLYIVTYNSEYCLNTALFAALSNINRQISRRGAPSKYFERPSGHELQIFIINNHSNFHLHDEFKDKVTVLHNVLSSEFSLGNLGRSWNQALIHGFVDLNNPDCDLVILAQDDCNYLPEWLDKIYEIHFKMGYHFFSVGAGDMLHSYTPTVIKKVGMWDERFNPLCFAEHDYFIRLAMHLGTAATINDTHHIRGLFSINPISIAHQVANLPPHTKEKLELRRIRTLMDQPARDLFETKWGEMHERLPVSRFLNKVIIPGSLMTILYPHFEKNVEDLAKAGYRFTRWSR